VAGAQAAEPVDDGSAQAALDRTLAGMGIEIRALEVHAMAGTLREAAGEADWIGIRLRCGAPVGGPLQPAAEAFLECHRTAGAALAGELRWLGSTLTATADSWTRLDGVVVRPAVELPAA
jgi:hypothetical protein